MGSSGLLIYNGNVILPGRILRGAQVRTRGAVIASVGRDCRRGARSGTRVDARGCYISPGFIDSHIHGDPRNILDNEIRHGTTSIVVAQSCAPLGEIRLMARKIAGFIRSDPLGPSVIGMRLEGPYISPAKAGAQDRRYIRRPDRRELAGVIGRCSPVLKMMTIAPEAQGALPLVRLLAAKGVIASIGHTGASFEAARAGIRAGARHATHIFNAMSGKSGRREGACGAALASLASLADGAVWAEVIADLVHVRTGLLRLLMRSKRHDRIVLVTDSVRAGHPAGVKKARGAYRFPDGRLAGSSLTMIDAVKNACGACGLGLADAVGMAALNPARLFGVDRKKGSIAAGKDADIVIFDKKFDIKMAVVRGKIMFRKRGF